VAWLRRHVTVAGALAGKVSAVEEGGMEEDIVTGSFISFGQSTLNHHSEVSLHFCPPEDAPLVGIILSLLIPLVFQPQKNSLLKGSLLDFITLV
jgi:hypothetical protein